MRERRSALPSSCGHHQIAAFLCVSVSPAIFICLMNDFTHSPVSSGTTVVPPGCRCLRRSLPAMLRCDNSVIRDATACAVASPRRARAPAECVGGAVADVGVVVAPAAVVAEFRVSTKHRVGARRKVLPYHICFRDASLFDVVGNL
jgi:hypothetical protein